MYQFIVRDDGTNNYVIDRDYHIVFNGELQLAKYGQYHTIEDYLANGWKIISEEEFDKAEIEYHESICNHWEEITEGDYDYALNCLPPMRWYDGGFFVCEAICGNVYMFYQKWLGKYYKSMQFYNTPRDTIIHSLVEFIKEGAA